MDRVARKANVPFIYRDPVDGRYGVQFPAYRAGRYLGYPPVSPFGRCDFPRDLAATAHSFFSVRSNRLNTEASHFPPRGRALPGLRICGTGLLLSALRRAWIPRAAHCSASSYLVPNVLRTGRLTLDADFYLPFCPTGDD